MYRVPVYLITGFLESGKSTFIDEVLQSPDFADGEKTLLILTEEGEYEFDEALYNRHNVDIVTIENEEDLIPEKLEYMAKKCKAIRVFVEFNGMWDTKKFVEEKMPKTWDLVQTITLVNGATFDMFLNNMKGFLTNIFGMTEMVIFNRCSPEMDLQKFRRAVKGVNPGVMVDFEDETGAPIDLGAAEPPYDLNADVIEIPDVDWGLWFLDMTDNPDRYNGKTVKFIGKAMVPKKFPEGCFIPGRNAMTCCANDIRFIGYICRAENMADIKPRSWVEVTAKIGYEYMKEYDGEGPVLTAVDVKAVEEPKDELVYFN